MLVLRILVGERWNFDRRREVIMQKLRAFTLIELLVVIAIIAVLMAILMPTLNRAKEQGKRAACLSNVKQMTLGWMMYADDNDQKIVSGRTAQNSWVYWPGRGASEQERIDRDQIRLIVSLLPGCKTLQVPYRCARRGRNIRRSGFDEWPRLNTRSRGTGA